MKKYVFYQILILVFVIINSTFAQKLEFGPEIGLNIIPIEKSEVDGHVSKLGFNGGGFVSYPINDWLSVKFGLKIATCSKSYLQTDTSAISEMIINAIAGSGIDTSMSSQLQDFINLSVTKYTRSNTNFTFLNIPVTADFNLNEKFSFSLGGYFALLLAAKTKEEITQDIPILQAFSPVLGTNPLVKQIISGMYPGVFEPSFSEKSGVSDFNSFDTGLEIAMRYKMENNFSFSASFKKGFINYYKDLPDMYEVNSGKHNYLTLSVGYSFGNVYTSKAKRRYDIPQE
ncbi:MAG: hypothetical protein A2046_10125 [Bacteroidetes bacterium GWA2_30_7]|nr:MAG: hypothetical protein A2046_10125 [Bacteroidetes bacterium GWA2_30_7]